MLSVWNNNELKLVFDRVLQEWLFLYTRLDLFWLFIVERSLYRINKREGHVEHRSNVNILLQLRSRPNYRAAMEIISTICNKVGSWQL